MPPFPKSGNRNLTGYSRVLAGDSGNARRFPSARAAGLERGKHPSLLSGDRADQCETRHRLNLPGVLFTVRMCLR
jgi:hypothetical protein